MTSSTQRNIASYGSLALDGGARNRLRVVEGGRKASHKAAGQQRRSSAPIALCVVFMMLVLGFTWMGVDRMASARVSHALSDASVERVTVMPGDSLWQIAAEHPVRGCTTEQIVNHIIAENDLTDAMLRPGMQLSVPCEGVSC